MKSNLTIVDFRFLFSLRIRQEDRPLSYDEILASPIMQSLPEEITDGETQMVKTVLENIPSIPDDY